MTLNTCCQRESRPQLLYSFEHTDTYQSLLMQAARFGARDQHAFIAIETWSKVIQGKSV